MALSAGTQIEIRTGGSDTICGGGFDPTQTAGMFTDGAATVANTASPVFSSASYTFVAGDVDAYVFIGAGTNWTRGWYKIVSVNAGAATLSASALGYQAYSTSTNESAGCASVASPTGATWSIDYSQQNAAQFTATDGTAAGAGSTLSSATIGFGSQMVGNVVRITAGTNATTGHHVITSVAAGVATFNNAVTTGATSNVTMYLGGALASIGYAGGVHIVGNTIWIAYNATPYSTTSASSNVANGRFTGSNGSVSVFTTINGYATVRGDDPTGSTRPTLAWGVNGASNYIIGFGEYSKARCLIIDGDRATYTNTFGLQGNIVYVEHCRFTRCTGPGIAPGNLSTYAFCEFDNCSGGAGGIGTLTMFFVGCYFRDNSNTTNVFTNGNGIVRFERCIFDTCTTAITGSGTGRNHFDACVFYSMTGAGVAQTSAPVSITMFNCIFDSCSTYGLSLSSAYSGVYLRGCAFYNNTSGKYQNVTPDQVEGEVVLTASPFVDAANGDFRLNLKTGGGASLRGAGYPSTFPGLTWANHRDIGAAQHTGRRHGDLDG